MEESLNIGTLFPMKMLMILVAGWYLVMLVSQPIIPCFSLNFTELLGSSFHCFKFHAERQTFGDPLLQHRRQFYGLSRNCCDQLGKRRELAVVQSLIYSKSSLLALLIRVICESSDGSVFTDSWFRVELIKSPTLNGFLPGILGLDF